MTTAAAPKPRVTPEEYLALERKAECKSECINGEIYAMGEASKEHEYTAGDVFGELRTQLRGGPCRVFSSNMGVWIPVANTYTHPDVSVACGDIQFKNAEVDTLLNPTVVVEVISPSTKRHDRGMKSLYDRELESLAEYVLIAQDRVWVERHERGGGFWKLSDLRQPSDVLCLESIGCEIPLSEIYRQVEFPHDQAAADADAA